MHDTATAGDRDRRGTARNAGLGAIAFGVLTLAQLQISDSPGGSYDQASVASFLASGHRVAVIVLFQLAVLGILGLVAFMAELRAAAAAASERAANVVWGLGVAAAACFTIGWGIDGGLALSHTEGGKDVVVTPATTYVLSEIGTTFIFGCGAILLGLALLAYVRAAGATLPRGVRVATAVAGVAGVAGLAFFTFFLQMLLIIGVGVALVVRRQQQQVNQPAPALA